MFRTTVFVFAYLCFVGGIIDSGIAKKTGDVQVEAPATKDLTPEEIEAKKIKDAVAEANKLCAKQKLDLLNTFINHLRNFEKSTADLRTNIETPLSELRATFEDLRDKEKQ